MMMFTSLTTPWGLCSRSVRPLGVAPGMQNINIPRNLEMPLGAESAKDP